MRADIKDPNIETTITVRSINLVTDFTYTIPITLLINSGLNIEWSVSDSDEFKLGNVQSSLVTLEFMDEEEIIKINEANMDNWLLTIVLRDKTTDKTDYLVHDYRVKEFIKVKSNDKVYKITATSDNHSYKAKNSLNKTLGEFRYTPENVRKTSDEFLNVNILKFLLYSKIIQSVPQTIFYDINSYGLDDGMEEKFSIKPLDLYIKDTEGDMFDSAVREGKSTYDLLREYLEANLAFGLIEYDPIGKVDNFYLSFYPTRSLYTTYMMASSYYMGNTTIYKEEVVQQWVMHGRQKRLLDNSRLNIQEVNKTKFTNVYICPDVFDINIENKMNEIGILNSISRLGNSVIIQPKKYPEGNIYNMVKMQNNVFRPKIEKTYDFINNNLPRQLQNVAYYPGTVTIPLNLNIRAGDAVLVYMANDQKKTLSVIPMLVGRVKHSSSGTSTIYSPNTIKIKQDINFYTNLTK